MKKIVYCPCGKNVADEHACQVTMDLKNREIERLRAALKLYVNAGFGNSTNFCKQGDAYDAAVEVLGLTPNKLGNSVAEGDPVSGANEG